MLVVDDLLEWGKEGEEGSAGGGAGVDGDGGGGKYAAWDGTALAREFLRTEGSALLNRFFQADGDVQLGRCEQQNERDRITIMSSKPRWFVTVPGDRFAGVAYRVSVCGRLGCGRAPRLTRVIYTHL